MTWDLIYDDHLQPNPFGKVTQEPDFMWNSLFATVVMLAIIESVIYMERAIVKVEIKPISEKFESKPIVYFMSIVIIPKNPLICCHNLDLFWVMRSAVPTFVVMKVLPRRLNFAFGQVSGLENVQVRLEGIYIPMQQHFELQVCAMMFASSVVQWDSLFHIFANEHISVH